MIGIHGGDYAFGSSVFCQGANEFVREALHSGVILQPILRPYSKNRFFTVCGQKTTTLQTHVKCIVGDDVVVLTLDCFSILHIRSLADRVR